MNKEYTLPNLIKNNDNRWLMMLMIIQRNIDGVYQYFSEDEIPDEVKHSYPALIRWFNVELKKKYNNETNPYEKHEIVLGKTK